MWHVSRRHRFVFACIVSRGVIFKSSFHCQFLLTFFYPPPCLWSLSSHPDALTTTPIPTTTTTATTTIPNIISSPEVHQGTVSPSRHAVPCLAGIIRGVVIVGGGRAACSFTSLTGFSAYVADWTGGNHLYMCVIQSSARRCLSRGWKFRLILKKWNLNGEFWAWLWPPLQRRQYRAGASKDEEF